MCALILAFKVGGVAGAGHAPNLRVRVRRNKSEARAAFGQRRCSSGASSGWMACGGPLRSAVLGLGLRLLLGLGLGLEAAPTSASTWLLTPSPGKQAPSTRAQPRRSSRPRVSVAPCHWLRRPSIAGTPPARGSSSSNARGAGRPWSSR